MLGTGGGMPVEHDDASRIRHVIDIDIASGWRRSGDLSPPTTDASARGDVTRVRNCLPPPPIWRRVI
jgi:hypothetical protein